MNAHDLLRQLGQLNLHILTQYVSDLSDADLMRRPSPTSNHLAWQLGHLIAAEADLLAAIRPDAERPQLPADFAAKHTKATIGSDDPAAFYSKAEYLELYERVRAASLATLDTMTAEDLDAPSPEHLRAFFPSVGSLFLLIASHPLMHSGQFAVVRRLLDKPVLI